MECYKPENKDFPWFPSFRFVPYTEKGKLGNPGNSSKSPKYWNVSMQLQKLFKYCSNDINLKMIQPRCYSCSSWVGFKSFWTLWIYQIEPVSVYVSFNTETVKKVVKTQIHMHWSAINQKIKIFRDFRVFVLYPIHKNENSEIPKIYPKPQNTEIRWTKHWKAKIVLLIWWLFWKRFLRTFYLNFFLIKETFYSKKSFKNTVRLFN